jgi:hypothetical protein
MRGQTERSLISCGRIGERPVCPRFISPGLSPNRPDDPEYIVQLLGQVVTVSVETVQLVRELAGLSIDQA